MYGRSKLCGGKTRFDLTVMDFCRSGMQGAIPRFRDDVDGLNIMRKAGEHAAIAKGREHHADWFRLIDHPDAQLIEEAPAMRLALKMILTGVARVESSTGEFCFNGLRYSTGLGWSSVIDAIGWRNAERSVGEP